jgi:glucose-1-phosphatase
MIRTVIFDLGGVIVPLDFPRGYAAMGPYTSIPPEEIARRLAATDLLIRLESGGIEPGEFHEQICELLGMTVDYAGFEGLWSSIFRPETLIPENLLVGLKKRHRLLLLSNTNAIHFPMIERNYPLLRHFDEFVLSYRVKAMKPARAIYEEAVARSGCSAGECFFTDDVEAYVDGALRVGIDAVQFRGYEELLGELGRRGILDQ